MNDLTRADSSRQLAGVAVPAPSRWLTEQLRDARNPHADIGYRPVSLRPGLAEEAKRHIAVLDRVLLVAMAPDWERWLKPLAVLPNAPAGGDKFRLEVSAIAFANNDVPAALLTVERQRDALRRFGFWPTPKDVAELFRPFVREVQHERVALQRIATAGDRLSPPPPSESERERIRSGMAGLVAELADRGHETAARERRPSARAMPLSDGALLAEYDRIAAGSGACAAAAQVCADALRVKLEKQSRVNPFSA